MCTLRLVEHASLLFLVPFNSIGLIIFSFAALKIDYSQVIDTAYIFKYANLPTTASPSLNSLCKVLA